ncbi:hypothetical protein HDU96_003208 [Phlyctochytrium bullatum]|nr:hypothetical protein HDU96_003208 [Phlyctochytrium bullatum]
MAKPRVAKDHAAKKKAKAAEKPDPVESTSDISAPDALTSTTSPIPPPLPAEVLQIIHSDAGKFSDAVSQLNARLGEIRQKVRSLQERVDSGELDTYKGVSLLEVKSHSLLAYITDLSVYSLLKLQGQKVESHPVIDKLIEHRVVMERTRPLEQKLKYQIDKLLRTVATSVYEKVNQDMQEETADNIQGADPLQFKPNPSNLVSASEMTATEEETSAKEKDGIYRPPKVAPMPYEEKTKGPKGKLTDKERRKSGKSRIIYDLVEQLENKPEERTSHGTGQRVAERKSQEEEMMDAIMEREEENFTRYTTTRAQRKAEERKMRLGGTSGLRDEIEDLERDFLSIQSVDRAVAEEDMEKFGVGLNAKRKRKAVELQERGPIGKRKARFETMDDVVSHAAERATAATAFDKAKRRIEKPRQKRARSGDGMDF